MHFFWFIGFVCLGIIFARNNLFLPSRQVPVSKWSDIHQISKLFWTISPDYTASIVLPESVKTGIEESKSGLSRHLFPSVPQSSQEAKWLRVDDAMKWWATSCANGIPTFATSHICSWTKPMHLNQSLCDKKLAQGKGSLGKGQTCRDLSCNLPSVISGIASYSQFSSSSSLVPFPLSGVGKRLLVVAVLWMHLASYGKAPGLSPI